MTQAKTQTLRPPYWSQACAELSARDETMATLIAQFQNSELRYRSDPVITLARAIVSQQISVKAAESIWNRLVQELGELSPQRLAQARVPMLRKAGLSERKAEYLKNVGMHFHKGILVAERWHDMADEAVIEELCQLKGIGRWTAEMFLIFNLQRPDVFPLADIGVVKAINRHYNGDRAIGPRKLGQLDKRWRPWRTVATWYLWRSLDPIPVEY